MLLGSLRTSNKELPEEYRGRTCPQYPYGANIAGCRPISLNKHFERKSGRGLSDRYRIGKEFGMVGMGD